MRENYLFYTKGSLGDFLESQRLKIKEEVDDFDEDNLLNVSEEDLARSLLKKYILDPPTLKTDEKYLFEPKEVDVDVSRDPNRIIFDRGEPFYIKGTSITVIIPFEGDDELFNYQASTFSTVIPRGSTYKNELHLDYTATKHDSDSLKKKIEHDIGQIESHLGWMEKDVTNFNNSLEGYIKELIKTRKEKLLKDRNLVGALDIPIKKQGDTSGTFAIPITPKKIKIELPSVKTEKFQPEPAIPTELYEEILDIIENMAVVIERNPKSFTKATEENIRDHFLVQLNGRYKGEAMGEVFNYQGRTDILIRHKGKNAFIAECKFWKGKKKLLETIDQLLRYTSWRDTKTAVLLFNRGRKLSEILNKISEVTKKHSCYKKWIKTNNETKFRYILHLPNDPNREIILSIIVFNIPKL